MSRMRVPRTAPGDQTSRSADAGVPGTASDDDVSRSADAGAPGRAIGDARSEADAGAPGRALGEAPSAADAGALGRALGDPLRLAILERLMAGPAAVSDLVATTRRSQPNVSNHLAVLRSAGLVRQTRRGRQVLYELGGPAAAQLVEAIALVLRPRVERPTVTAPLAAARTCYDHLAGRLGVAIFDGLVARGALVPRIEQASGKPRPLGRDADAALGPASADVFGSVGIDVDEVRRSTHRRLTPVCLDWTEQRPHLGGGLGAAIWTRSVAEGWVRPQPGTRVVIVTPAGRAAFDRLLGAAEPESVAGA